MTHYYAKQDGSLMPLVEPELGCWVNISSPFSQEELEEAANRFDVPLDFFIDSLDLEERSRYEREEDVRLIVINTPVLNTESEHSEDALYITVPIGLILTPDHLITITAYDNPVVDLFLDNRIKNFDPSDHNQFVLQIMEQTVFRFLACLKNINTRRNHIEKELYHSSKNKELRDLLGIEKSLVYFVNALRSNELLQLKMKRVDILQIRQDEDKVDLFEDIIIDNGQALEMANVYSNILSGTMDAYASIISNNLNVTIHRLTLVTIFLSLPTLMASIYGMNVPLPFQEEGYALLIVLAIALILSLAMGYYFVRKRLF